MWIIFTNKCMLNIFPSIRLRTCNKEGIVEKFYRNMVFAIIIVVEI